MEVDETENLSNIYEFPFHCLMQLNTENEGEISDAISILQKYLEQEEFYANTNKCLDYTLEFILTNVHFLIKKAGGGTVLDKIMELFADLFLGLQENFRKGVNSPVDLIRVLNSLGKLMESPQDNYLKRMGGMIIISILETNMIDHTTLNRFVQIVLYTMDLFNIQENVFELTQLFIAILKYPMNNVLFKRVKQWIDEMVPIYLVQAISVEATSAVLKLLMVYYTEWAPVDDPNDNSIINNFNTLLPHLCYYMQDVDFRLTAEPLLEIVVYNLHYRNFNGFDNRQRIIKEIQTLPNRLQHWPSVDTGVFFVIVYLDILTNMNWHWNNQDILQAMKRSISPIAVLEQPILKCLLYLYPTIKQYNTILDITNMGKALINIIATHRKFSELLTYNDAQIKWLLKNSDNRFKTNVLIAWLKFQKNDVEIVKILEECKMGHELVKFLVQHSDVPLASRVSQLIVQLKKDIHLNKAILWAMPLLCNRPNIISSLVQVRPDISRESQDVLNTINTVSVCMTFFVDDIAIQSACVYLQDLIKVVGYKIDILEPFFKFSACIRFLCIKAGVKNDYTAIAALGLLRHLIRIQIYLKCAAINPVEIEFVQVLQNGNTKRLIHALRLLQTALTVDQQNLLIVVNQKNLLILYHHIHILTKEDTASDAFKVLRLLIDMQPKLMFSLSTPLCLQLVCNRDLSHQHYRPFMDFLECWLKYITKYWYISVPVKDLRGFLQKDLKHDKQFSKIMLKLNEYDHLRSLHHDQL